MTVVPEFVAFPSIPRLVRDIIVSEKIDGTNAQVVVSDDMQTIRAGSRNKWITPQDDNAGFARWVHDNQEQLIKELGPGQHFGEWWGAGVQRRYNQKTKRFSLFNTTRWTDAPRSLCDVVPVLYQGPFSMTAIEHCLQSLRDSGSVAAPGFMNPEGVVIFHVQSGHLYKLTVDGDGHKGAK
jgi:hypothetical protein